MRLLCVQFTFCIFFLLTVPTMVMGSDNNQDNNSDNNIETTLGGQVKLSFLASDYKKDSIQLEFKDDTWMDSGLSLRIMSRVYFTNNLSFDCHYLFSSSLGDTIKAQEFFSQNYSGTILAQLFQRNFDDNNTKLFDLSSKIKDKDNYFIFHRLDRFNLSFDNEFGRIILGRQAVTWGNGLVFNPMDVFNSFSPYDTERDYKKGDDMAYFEKPFENGDNLQLIYVPRRALEDGSIKFSQSSVGVKYHLYIGDMEFDLLSAKHYRDFLAGIGCVGTIGNAVFRSDLLYTFAGGNMEEDFLSFVMNIDYSWVWFSKNFYGSVEYYHSGLGVDGDYSEVFIDYDLSTRISRGEIFGFGKNYLSSSVTMELNPLLNLNFIVIANLNDPSCLIQPGLVWNAAENFEITIGANYTMGKKGDEYGQIPFASKNLGTGSSLFFRGVFFF